MDAILNQFRLVFVELFESENICYALRLLINGCVRPRGYFIGSICKWIFENACYVKFMVTLTSQMHCDDVHTVHIACYENIKLMID